MNTAAPAPPWIEMQGAAIAALNDTAITVLDDVNWSVRSGEFWMVVGSHHSGKSDLLLHAAGLLTPAAGTCRILGTETVRFSEAHLAERLRIGFVFSDLKLFKPLTIAENIALPLRYHRQLSADETARTVAALLELLELAPHANALPAQVSLAWRHRAALARALILKPGLLLLDNPQAGLTTRQQQWLVGFLDQLWRGHDFFGGQPMTIVVATDDLPPWRHAQRQFAAVQEGIFSILGAWDSPAFASHPTVRELLATPPPEREKTGPGPQTH